VPSESVCESGRGDSMPLQWLLLGLLGLSVTVAAVLEDRWPAPDRLPMALTGICAVLLSIYSG
jgi:hypothetical protein